MNLDDGYYKKVLDNLYDGIYFIDQDKSIVYWNRGAEEHTGYKASEVIGRKCWDNLLMHVDQNGFSLCEGLCPISQTIAEGCLREFDVYFQHKEGHRVPVTIRVAPIEDVNKQVVIAVEIFNENSPKFQLHQTIGELKKLALIDALTETGNRAFIETNIKGRLEELHRYDWSFGILFIDIDHFKSINDKYGHAIGDRALKMVSRTMENSLRSFDLIGRWGGEEFIAIIVNVNKEQLYLIGNRLRTLVEKSSMTLGSDIVRATISVGGTIARKSDDIHTIIKRADQMMYRSKNSGRNCVSVDLDLLTLKAKPDALKI